MLYYKLWRIWIILLHLTKAFNWNFIHARPRQKNERKKGRISKANANSLRIFLEDSLLCEWLIESIGKWFGFFPYALKWVHSIIFVSNVFHNSHLIQKCIQNQQLLLISTQRWYDELTLANWFFWKSLSF